MDTIVDLQARIAFQEDMIASLNTQVAEQQQDINVLQTQLAHIYGKLKDIELGMLQDSGQLDNQPPPHY